MAYHVIYRESDGYMWQSYEQDTALPLPEGYSQPDGHAIKSFAGPPSLDKVWHASSLNFVPALVAEKDIAKAAVDKDEYTHRLVLRALVLVIADEINVVRTDPLTIHTARKVSQLKTAIKDKIESLS